MRNPLQLCGIILCAIRGHNAINVSEELKHASPFGADWFLDALERADVRRAQFAECLRCGAILCRRKGDSLPLRRRKVA